MKEEYKYVWEKSRNLYRVVIDHPTYDKESQKTIHHYVTVGKAKEKNGEIEFGAKYLLEHQGKISQQQEARVPVAKEAVLCGERIVLDEAARRTGLKRILTSTVGKENAEKILQLAYYWNCTGAALCDSAAWFKERGFPELSSPRISELMRVLTEEYCSSFIRKWVRKKAASRKVCYDITSVSTYASDIDIAEYGYNRDHERWLRQINLAMVADQETHMPLAFREIRGSVNDASTLVNTVSELIAYDAKPEGLVMDRGFWTESNMSYLAENGVKCMIPVPSKLSWSKKLIKEMKARVYENSPYVDSDDEATYWYTVYDPRKEGRRAWAHLFYSPRLESDRKDSFMRKYHRCKQELMDGAPIESHQRFYDEYFELSTRGRGGRLHVKEKYHMDEILANENFGYWILYTDFEKDAVQALLTYRDRNFIEVGFDDMKGSTDGRRLRVHSTDAVYGRLFLQFCSQILRTELRTMTETFRKETRKYATSPKDMLYRMRSLTKIRYKGRYKDQYVTLSKGQRLILEDIGIDLDLNSDSDTADTEALINSDHA